MALDRYAVTVKYAVEGKFHGNWVEMIPTRHFTTMTAAKAAAGRYRKSFMFRKYRVVQVVTHENRIIVHGA